MDKDTLASIMLQYQTTIAARTALGHGIHREEVARCLEDLAAAIRDPGTVPEDMNPIYTGNLISELVG
jgi:hypothetical protein